MTTQTTVSTVADQVHGRLVVGMALDRAQIREAQILRYRVFAEELGAVLHTPFPGIDHDPFDDYCRHLVVRDLDTGEVVACTRILEGWQADRAGGFYASGEFRIDPVLALPGRKLEIGRTCVDARHRSGSAIAVLWSGLADFITRHRYDYLLGCASIAARDGGILARAIMEQLRCRHMAPESLRVTPHRPIPETPSPLPPSVRLPALLRAYMSLGARVCGEPCLDPDFRVADLFILLDLRALNVRYARHFLDGPTRRARLAA